MKTKTTVDPITKKEEDIVLKVLKQQSIAESVRGVSTSDTNYTKNGIAQIWEDEYKSFMGATGAIDRVMYRYH